MNYQVFDKKPKKVSDSLYGQVFVSDKARSISSIDDGILTIIFTERSADGKLKIVRTKTPEGTKFVEARDDYSNLDGLDCIEIGKIWHEPI